MWSHEEPNEPDQVRQKGSHLRIQSMMVYIMPYQVWKCDEFEVPPLIVMGSYFCGAPGIIFMSVYIRYDNRLHYLETSASLCFLVLASNAVAALSSKRCASSI